MEADRLESNEHDPSDLKTSDIRLDIFIENESSLFLSDLKTSDFRLDTFIGNDSVILLSDFLPDILFGNDLAIMFLSCLPGCSSSITSLLLIAYIENKSWS